MGIGFHDVPQRPRILLFFECMNNDFRTGIYNRVGKVSSIKIIFSGNNIILASGW